MSQVASRLRGEGGERGVGKRVVVACAVLTPGILSLPLPSPFASSPHSGEIGARVDQPYGPRQETGDTRRHNGSETFPRMRVWQGDRLPHDTGGPVFHLPYSATVEPYSRVLSVAVDFTVLFAWIHSLHTGTSSPKSSRSNPCLHEFCRHRKPLICGLGVFDTISHTHHRGCEIYYLYLSVRQGHV